MVDFRYHLVSIIAVFLALAVGIVLGTTTINPGVVNNLESQVKRLTNDKADANARNDNLQQQLDSNSRFAREVLPLAVTSRLAGERLVMVSLPGARGDVRDGVQKALQSAGAVVVGRIRLQDKLVDQEQAAAVATAARNAAGQLALPAGTPVQQVSELLAQVLTGPQSEVGEATRPPVSTSPILSAFERADLVRVEGDRPVAVTTVVFVAPPPADPVPADSAERVKAVKDIVTAFARRARSVMAAPTGGAAASGVLDAVRNDAALSTDVSTVDNADQPAGQTALVFALVERLKGRFGHYGSGPGADSAMPDIVAVS